MPSWLGVNWTKMCMWAEKWQRSFNVTKSKKTHLGEINLRIWLTIVQPQPGEEAQMAENYSLKTVLRGATAIAQRLREMRRKILPTARALGIQQRAPLCPLHPVQWAAGLGDSAVSCMPHQQHVKMEIVKGKTEPNAIAPALGTTVVIFPHTEEKSGEEGERTLDG